VTKILCVHSLVRAIDGLRARYLLVYAPFAEPAQFVPNTFRETSNLVWLGSLVIRDYGADHPFVLVAQVVFAVDVCLHNLHRIANGWSVCHLLVERIFVCDQPFVT